MFVGPYQYSASIMNMLGLLSVAACAVVSRAQVFGPGSCPNAQAQSSFDLNKYLGDWYEIYKFYAAFESGQSCAKAHYELKDDGHIKIVNSGFKDGKQIQAIGDAYIPDPQNDPAKLKLRFSSLAPYGNYWVLDTDYDNYTFIYSCSGVLGITHYEFAWVLARQPNITEEVKTKLFDEAKAFGIDTSNFKFQDRTGCPNN